MPRPSKPKQIGYTPDFVSFRPDGIPCDTVVSLSLEELETIRLIDHQRLTQEETAARMGVGRTTVTALYESSFTSILPFLLIIPQRSALPCSEKNRPTPPMTSSLSGTRRGA